MKALEAAGVRVVKNPAEIGHAVKVALGRYSYSPSKVVFMGRKRAARFDPRTFLSIVDGGKNILKCRKKQALFSQGETADAVFYLLGGKVKLTVLSSKGKEAVIAILGQGEFLASCLTGQ